MPIPPRFPSPRAARLLAGALVAAVLGACSGGDGETQRPARTTTTTVVAAEVSLELGEAAVQSAGGDIALDEATQRAAVDVAQRYVDTAVLAPLVGGKVGKDYEALFDAGAAPGATGFDRGALTDEGVTKVSASPDVTATPVRIDALAGGDGALQLLAASFDLDVRGETATGPLAIARTTELTLAPAADGAWAVTAYRVVVTRDLPTGATTTTAARSTTTGDAS